MRDPIQIAFAALDGVSLTERMHVRLILAEASYCTKRDKLIAAIVWKLPHHLVYMCGIRLWANATTGEFGNEEAPAILCDTAVERWGSRRGGDPSFHRGPSRAFMFVTRFYRRSESPWEAVKRFRHAMRSGMIRRDRTGTLTG